MNKINKILGSSSNTYFIMDSGDTIVASSEFRAESGDFDGVIVYTQSLKFKETNKHLSKEQVDDLILMYETYKNDYNDIVEFV